MSFSATDPASRIGQTDTWLTPLWIIEALGNDFETDPCAFPGHNTAKIKYSLPEMDGLVHPWHGKVWLNPPYSDVKTWLERLAKHGFGTALVFNRLDTKTMQEHVKKASSVFLIEGRLKFLTSDFTEKHNAGCGSMLISYGYTPDYSKLKGWIAK